MDKDMVMFISFMDEIQKIGATAAEIEKKKAAPPQPDRGGGPGKGKNDPNFIKNIGRGFAKAAAAKPGESKVSALLASMKKEPKRKA